MNTDILLLAENLELGETIRTICPRCHGGSKEEKSLTITLGDDGIVWNCFRAKCDERGGTGTRVVPPEIVQKKKNTPKKFTAETRSLRENDLELIEKRWGIISPPHWYWTDAYGGRVAMSIRSPKFLHRGWVLRDMTGRSRCKALTYIEPGEEALSWYKTTPHAPTILVEDIPSAVRASKYMNSCALLGTGIGVNKALEISTYSTTGVIIALDQDATAQSFKLARKYSLLWGTVEVLPLKRDIKDMSEEELQGLLT